MMRPNSSSNKADAALRCDSVTSEDYLDISSSPEPLRVLNRYRELCRIFRVQHANSFLVRTLLAEAWQEIQAQLVVIRARKHNAHVQTVLKERDAAQRLRVAAQEEQQQQQQQQQQRQSKRKSVMFADGGAGAGSSDVGDDADDEETESEEDLRLIPVEPYVPYAWRSRLRTIDCSRTYLGPRGIVALCALVAEMPWVEELDLSRQAWFMGDDRPGFCPTGEEVVRVMVLLLAAHPSLEVLRLDGNLFATGSYVWLLDLIKRSQSAKLREISLAGSLLEPFQIEHVNGALARSVVRRQRYADTVSERTSFVQSAIAAESAHAQAPAQAQAQSRSANVTTSTEKQQSPVSDNNDSPFSTDESPRQHHLDFGATSNRRGWNYLVQYVAAHADFIRWGVLVARELAVTQAATSAGSLGTVVPASPKSIRQKQRELASPQLSPEKLRSDPRTSSPTKSQRRSQLKTPERSVPHPQSQSLVYIMSGQGPNVLPGARSAVAPHPFTADTCRFQVSPPLQALLEAVMKCSPILSLLDGAQRADLLQRGRIIKRPSRAVIMEAGDPSDFVYVVLHGGLEIRGRPQVMSASVVKSQLDGSVSDASLGQYFAAPSIFPCGALVGGEELINPNITQAERRTATFVVAPCQVLPPTLCRRALLRQTISTDPAKADAVVSNLPIVDACYDGDALLARANQELEFATERASPTKGHLLREASLVQMEQQVTREQQLAEIEEQQQQQQQKKKSGGGKPDPYRGERLVTVDGGDDAADADPLQMGAEAGGTQLRQERLRELYGIQSGAALRRLEHEIHSKSVYNQIEDRQQQQAASDAANEAADFTKEHDAVTVLYLIPRDVFCTKLLSAAREQRKQWGSFLDSLPSLVSLPAHFKNCLADCMRRRQFTQGEIVAAGFSLLDLIFVVVEGQASIYFQRSEIKRLNRGEVFVCHPRTDVSRVSIVVTSPGGIGPGGAASPNASANSMQRRASGIFGASAKESVSQLVLGVVAPTFAATLPIGLQRYLMRMRRVYSHAADPSTSLPDGS